MAINIGKKIKQLRNSKNISQEQLAEELNVSTQQLHKYETGKNKISVDKLLILSQKFGVDLNFFADDTLKYEHQLAEGAFPKYSKLNIFCK